MFEQHQLVDFVSLYVSRQVLLSDAINLNLLSAAMIGLFLAWAITKDAGWHCPIALLRMIHRIVLVAFSIALCWVSMFLIQNTQTLLESTYSFLLGPLVVLSFGIFISTIVSGIRHLFSPRIDPSNNWSNWGSLREDFMRNLTRS